MRGTIVKAISSFYYVEIEDRIYECRTKGAFKHKNIELAVGDKVDISITDEENSKGLIINAFKRRNFMQRPPIANVSQAILVFSIKSPDPNLSLIDRFIVTAYSENVDIVICLNKIDLNTDNILEEIIENYSKTGHPVIPICAETGYNIDAVKQYLKGNTTIVAGPSGAGKSTLINKLVENVKLKTGEVSAKIGRGKHTTRYIELLKIDEDSFIADSPGFSSINLDKVEERDLKEYFIEFHEYDVDCKFGNKCIHENEPGCKVKEAVEEKMISEKRYESYIQLLNEIREQNKRRNY
ncbi:MAG: ribosome small subunit-dependent GTPase A [Proteocatella sp.]